MDKKSIIILSYVVSSRSAWAKKPLPQNQFRSTPLKLSFQDVCCHSPVSVLPVFWRYDPVISPLHTLFPDISVPLRIIDFPFFTRFSDTLLQGCLKFTMTVTIANTFYQLSSSCTSNLSVNTNHMANLY